MAAKKKARKSKKTAKAKGRANGTVRPSNKKPVASKRNPKPAVAKRHSKKPASKKPIVKKRTTAKKSSRKKKLPRLPRPSIPQRQIRDIAVSFGKLVNIRNLEARLLEAQTRADEDEERKAIQEESAYPKWSESHPSKIVRQYQPVIDEWASIDDQNDPRVIDRLAAFIEITSYTKQDGEVGLFPSRLRHIEDSEDIKRRLGEHLFGTQDWKDEANKIAKEYDVWAREVYTLFYSP